MINSKLPLVIITGPTASGKTSLSLSIATKLDCEIISADSMQIYQDMDIGTDKVTKNIRKNIPHHMLDIISPSKNFSVADYQKKVDQLIPEIKERGHLPLMVGGTGLYIKSVVEGFMLPEMEPDYELREHLTKEAEEKGTEFVHSKLARIDPPLAEKLHPNDLRRVIRGIEVYQLTGKTKTYYKKRQKEKSNRYHTIKFCLKRDRENLYRKINQRVDTMLAEGLLDEVRTLQNKYEKLSKTARQALGYKELFAYLSGEITLDKAVYNIKQRTRNFAKRQLTWFRRDDAYQWFNLDDQDQEEVEKLILEKIELEFKEKKV